MANLSYTQIPLSTGTTENEGIGQKVFSFDFDFINSADIKAIVTNDPEAGASATYVVLELDGTEGTPYDSNGVDITNKKIILSANPSATAGVDGDSELRIYRATTKEAIVDFQAGSRISEADLDNAYKQGLYAAQEVQENASHANVGGALADNSVDHNHIKTDAVRSDEIKQDAVGTSELDSNSVTTAITADTMNWLTEGSTIVLPTANRNLGADDTNYGWNGVLAVNHGGTGFGSLKYSNVFFEI